VTLPTKTYYTSVPRCASCNAPHPQAELVPRDSSVYYRCTKNGYLIYIRERKDQK